MVAHLGTPLRSSIDSVRPHAGCCAPHRNWEANVRAALPQAIGAALLLVPSLTARERATFHLLGIGCDNHSIARRMCISERTAKRHVTAILIKLGLKSRLQAGLAAMALSLVETGPADRCAEPR